MADLLVFRLILLLIQLRFDSIRFLFDFIIYFSI